MFSRHFLLQLALAVCLVAFAFAGKPVPRAKGTGALDRFKEIVNANKNDLPCQDLHRDCRANCISEILTDDEVHVCQSACDEQLRSCGRDASNRQKIERVKALRMTTKQARVVNRQKRLDQQKLVARDMRVAKQVFAANSVKKVRR